MCVEFQLWSDLPQNKKKVTITLEFGALQLIDLDVSNFEYRIFVVVFSRQAHWKKSKQILKMKNLSCLVQSTAEGIGNVIKDGRFFRIFWPS